tara:strand:+ start:1010 stop:1207 length:198 start_codon:yes stop_codon:yes gene_type:complete
MYKAAYEKSEYADFHVCEGLLSSANQKYSTLRSLDYPPTLVFQYKSLAENLIPRVAAIYIRLSTA